MQQLLTNYTEARLDQEAALQLAQRKEKAEQHLYLGVRIITDDTFRAYGGTDLTTYDNSQVNQPYAPRFYRLLRRSTVKELLDQIGDEAKIDPRKIRLWSMVNRQNKTTRPDVPVPDVNYTIEEAHQRLIGSRTVDLRLWAEVAEEVDAEGEPIWPATPLSTNGGLPRHDLICLFLKQFDHENQSLCGIGHIYISREKKVEDLVPAILKKMGWSERTSTGEKLQMRLFEVSANSLVS